MQFQLLKVETQSVQVCWICTGFSYNITQFRRVELPCLGHQMVYPCLSHELERMISHWNLTAYKHWKELKILKKFKIVIAKKRKHQLHLQSA